jgi:hypothetical protein
LWKNAGVATVSPLAANTMSQEIQRVMATWVVQRINTINADGNVPAVYNLNTLNPLTFSAVDHSPVSGDQDQEYIEITNPNTVAIDLSGWQITGGVTFTFEPGTIVNGTVGVPAGANKILVAASRNGFKTRTVAPKAGQSLNVTGGFQGHLSNIGETLNLIDDTGTQRATTTYTGSATPAQQYLVITEVMYNPGGTGLAEFIELMNISSSVTLDLTGVHFSGGVEFTFTGSAVTSLPPGGRVLVVRDNAAFTTAHGGGLSIAGVFGNSSALNNGGETIKLDDAANNTVKEFTYDDDPPWPSTANGSSIVLKQPELNPDPDVPLNWRASMTAGGNPGSTDVIHFTGNPGDDLDKDGLTALMEYALGTSDTSAGSVNLHPVRGTDTGGFPYLEIAIARRPNADDAAFVVESSTDASTWSSAGWILMSSTPVGGGIFTEVWRLTGGAANGPRLFVHCKCSHL